ncbi:MAG: ankyrin repeat domain-containing protein [Syntrophorhabdaceae bacterium]|nr:ankyrin repeat domain-containing protein [Syntrophorhabdaceae bacterium]
MKTRGISHLAPAAMKKPLAGGKDPGQGSTPLHEACRSGNIRAARRLLDAGADPDAKNEFGYTPLHCACIHGHLNVTRLLLDHGADVNADDKNGWTPLHRACDKNLLAIARLLLENGAAIDVPDNWNYTPLHLASAGGHTEVVRLLLDHGADPDARNDEGRTPPPLGVHIRSCPYRPPPPRCRRGRDPDFAGIWRDPVRRQIGTGLSDCGAHEWIEPQQGPYSYLVSGEPARAVFFDVLHDGNRSGDVD